MRLLLVSVVLFIVPAGALLVADRYITEIEGEFYRDSSAHVERLHSIYQLYPTRLRQIPLTPVILQLKGLGSGGHIAAAVCGSSNPVFHRLFDHLDDRCRQWALYRRARYAGALSVLLAAIAFAVVLVARISVKRYASRELWPGNWTMWFVLRGMTLILAAQVAGALSGYGVVLQAITGKSGLTLAILAAPFLALLLVERKLVASFVEPQQLNVFRPGRGEKIGAAPQRLADAAPAAASSAAPERGVLRRRRSANRISVPPARPTTG